MAEEAPHPAQTTKSPLQETETLRQEDSWNRYQYTQLHLGVQVRIVLYAKNETQAIKTATEAFAKIATLEDIFSNYRPQSEISRLSKADTYQPIPVSNDLFDVIQFAQTLSSKTNGAFDITLGPYIELWKESQSTNRLPDRVKFESATHKVGWRFIETDSTNRTITLQQKGMMLDAGAIAKGYILDEALQVIENNGIRSALVEAGGDIVVSGAPPESSGWHIDVPGSEPNGVIALKASQLTHAAISTSGDTEQFVEIDGVRYSHVIDPSTGMGSTRRILVTVIASKGIIADSYSTALGVMDEREQNEFIERHPEIVAYIR